MRILIAHNSHKIAGGEQRVFENESELLADAGHQVSSFNIHNDGVDHLGMLSLAKKTIYNFDTSRELSRMILEQRPDIIHVHNIVPLISPSIFKAASKHKVPIVWTLHNYRLICPGMYLLRDEKTCEQCVSRRVALPAIRHKCYRNSRSATTAVVTMQLVHQMLGTWKKNIDRFITPSEFTKRKLVEGGLPENKIITKGNFVSGEPLVGDGKRDSFLFVGRLSGEKGIGVLLDTWQQNGIQKPLRIIGNGPLEDQVRQAASENPWIEFLGVKPTRDVYREMGEAMATIAPSTCYETFGMVVAESLSVGTPVIASDGGALAELIDPKVNGLLFERGNASALAVAINELATLDLGQIRKNSRESYEHRHTSQANLVQLESIYRDVIGNVPSSSNTLQAV